MTEAPCTDKPTAPPASARDPSERLKAEMGRRLVSAREAAELTQKEAAQRLGYTVGVHLCEAERGKRFMPHDVIACAAPLYGVTTDFLYGLQDTPEPDPVLAVQDAIAGRIAAEVHHLARTMVEETGALVRSYLPSGAQAQRLAGLVLEAHEALQRLRARCPAFDREMPSSAVVARMDLAAGAAAAYLDDVRRAQRMQSVRDRHAAVRALAVPLTLPVLPQAA